MTSLAVAMTVGGRTVYAATGSTDVEACTALATTTLAGTRIISASWVPANTPIAGIPYGPAPTSQPAHCWVRGAMGEHVGKDGVHYGIGFELRLPKHWNGRLLFQGGSGLDGTVVPALGLQGFSEASSMSALARGFAVVSDDGGHDQATLPAPGSFGADHQALADFEYASTKTVAAVAKSLARTYYRRPIRRAYFMGCSNGGREAMIAAQRYPEVFDGIVAGDPGFHLTRAMVAQAWNTATLSAIAPRGPGGMPTLAEAVTDDELKLVAGAILEKCDALDGVRDGIIGNPLACRVDLTALTCGSGQTERCLSAEKAKALQRVFSGPTNSAGEALYAGLPFDAGIAAPGWRLWMLGTREMPALNVLIAPQAVNGMALANAPPTIDILHMDFDRDPARIEAAVPDLNATSTDYSGLKQRGGKLLLYAGTSDPVFSASDLARYFEAVGAANGGGVATAEFARLFLVPGMNHCYGGPALDQFDALTAIQNWVEKGQAPERLLARGETFPGRTRPLCPYPKTAHFRGSSDGGKAGNVDDASSFVCR